MRRRAPAASPRTVRRPAAARASGPEAASDTVFAGDAGAAPGEAADVSPQREPTAVAETAPRADGAAPVPAPRREGRRRGPKPEKTGDAGPHRLIATSGPDPGTPLEEIRLTVGVFIGIHGVRGDAKMKLLTDDPEHLRTVKRLYLDDEPAPRRVEEVRLHAGNALVKLVGINEPGAARTLQGKTARIAGTDARRLEEGEFRLYQLIGLAVVDEAGEPVGTVTDLLETGANDVFVIARPGEKDELLLPYHESAVLEVDPGAGRMVVRLPVYYGEQPLEPAGE